MRHRDACLIVNPSAGGGRARRALPGVQRALERVGVRFRVERTIDLEHAASLARSALAADELTVAMGGDGLVGAVAGALRGTGGVAGIIPAGRGNDFARVLGLPRDPIAACEVLVSGVERVVDCGEVDGRPFVGIASVGFDSDANRIANDARLVRGKPVYLYAALRALAAWRPARFALSLDGERRELTGYSVAAANSAAYGGGMYLAPNAALDDGLLDVVTIGELSRRRFASQLPKVFNGSHVDHPAIEVFRAREVRVSADRPFQMYADGDPIGALPVTVRAVPAALRILVPPS